MGTSENRWMAVLAHVSYFFLPLIVPIILLAVKNEDPFVRHHAKQALVFHLFILGASLVASILIVVLIGLLLLPAVYLMGLILTIIATIRTLDNEFYRYPISGGWID
jgi:uncharacterized membrane protein